VACTKLAKDGLLTDEAMDSECRKFIDRVMPEAFRKLLTSNATFRWHTEIQEGIYNMLELFIDLILARLPHAPVPVSMLGTLAVALDLDNDWNSKNKDQTSMGRWQEDDRSSSTRTEYARAAGITSNRYGWLCDLINQFGDGDGFKILADCFRQENVTARDMAALLRPLGNSAEVLNKDVLHSLLTPCMELAFARVGKIGDAELRTKEVMAVSDLLMALKLCCHHFWPECTEQCDRQRLDMICRMLKTPQFNTRMNGLKEVSRLIEESDQPQLNHRYRSIINISSERLVDWMAENKVLTVALEGNIDQVQYTDRIKAIVEFLCPRLGTDDLDKMWQLQDSSPNSQIMENVYAIMASAASKFNLNQFEHLTTLIKKKWEASNDRVREKLLVLIGQIGREAKQTESIQATLQLLWEVSHLKTLPRHLVERALSEQLAIITEMNQSRDSQRRTYINECVEDIKQGEKLTVLPAVMHLHKLCKSYSKGSSSVYQKADKATLGELNRKHEIVKLLSVSLSRGHVWAVEIAGRKNGLKKDTIVDGRYTHDEFVSEHLKLMKFFLQEGDLYLSWGRSKEIWETLVDNRKAISFDQELCFNWFKECLADLENETQLDFFNQKLLSLSASAVSNSSFECFREYLESVNVNASKIRKNLSSSFVSITVKQYILFRRLSIILLQVVESLEPIGQNYLWTLVTDCPDESIANEAIDYLLKLSFLCVSPKLKKDSATLHKKFINQCYHRLETVIDMPLSTEKHEAVQEGCEVEVNLNFESPSTPALWSLKQASITPTAKRVPAPVPHRTEGRAKPSPREPT
jgi:ubiquitin carboxyl-terminal hydrolase 9/24